MSKNEKSKGKIALVVYCDKHTTKTGKFKGTKKEKKALKKVCPHYSYNKNDKLKPLFFNDGNGMCYCKRCSNKFPAKLVEGKTVEEAFNNVIQLLDQSLVGAIAIGVSSKTIDMLSETKVSLQTIKKKTYPRIMEAVTASDRSKNKKRKDKNRGNVAYGVWGSGNKK